MKQYMMIVILVLLLFSGCGMTFKSRTAKPKTEHYYVSVIYCHESSVSAKKGASHALVSKTSLPLLLKHHSLKPLENEYGHCYEATVNEQEWQAYLQDLANEKERLISQTRSLNHKIYFSKKPEVIKEILEKEVQFNTVLEASKKIAPVSISPFDLNQTRLETVINARPSVKMDYKPCAHHTNYRCQIGFISKVQDETKNIAYYWEFGDGAVSQRKNPLHTYQKEGTYTIRLRVEDNNSISSTVKSNIVVKSTSKPFALFLTKASGYRNLETIVFQNRSYTQRGKLTTFYWDFGDGKQARQQHPKHRYAKGGDYLVTLKVCNSKKQCSSVSKKLHIIQTKSMIDAHKGMPIEAYRAEHGEATDKIVKPNALMCAYKYKGVWLLVKRGKIACAVKEKGLVTNLMGQPKRCYWHEKHASKYMVDLQ